MFLLRQEGLYLRTRGGARLAETLHTELLAQVPLGAPDNHISEPDFSPSVYKADTPTAGLFAEVADKLIAKYEH